MAVCFFEVIMVFSNLFFIFVFFAACVTVYFLMPKIWLKNAVLIIFSLIFYAWGEPTYIVLLLLSTLVNYIAGLVIDKHRNKPMAKAAVTIAVIFNIALLFVFKYTDFFIENINFVCHVSIPLPHIRLPIGISFFTFQIMSYIIDCYWEKVDVQKNFFKLLLYISLFPQLIAGPIVRYSTIEKEISDRKSTFEDISEGATRFIVGMSKKVVLANGLNEVVKALLGSYDDTSFIGQTLVNQSFVGTLTGVICFALYVYFDFSGYSDMAIGMGRIFGFHFDENFKHPFVSRNITEFWQRWHISLGTFFRDYLLYLPIFGKRRKYLNLFLVWFCTGFWHGAAWNFILWGLYFGFFVFIETLIGKKRMKKIPAAISHIYSLLVITIGFGIFYFENFRDLTNFFKNLFFINGNAFIDPISKSTLLNSIFLIVLAAILSMPILPKLKKWFYSTEKRKKTAVCITAVTNVLLLCLCFVLLTDTTNNPFLYFRF